MRTEITYAPSSDIRMKARIVLEHETTDELILKLQNLQRARFEILDTREIK